MIKKVLRNLERHILGSDRYYQDPYDDPGEQFYARLYLKHLFELMDRKFEKRPLKILDLGCHTGRLAIPLARAGHEVTAIDSSSFHLKKGKEHAERVGVSCRFIQADGFEWVRQSKGGPFDLVVCTEVLYQLPDFEERLGELMPILRPGGLLATSHRTRFYYLVEALKKKDFETARRVVTHSEGKIWGSYFNWQSPRELAALYGRLGLEVLALRPVGVFASHGGEGLTGLCDLDELTPAEQEDLFRLEAWDSDEFAALGRYLLAIGRKKGD